MQQGPAADPLGSSELNDDFGALLDRAIARSTGKLIEGKAASRDPEINDM
jgi:hypothetical protein